jgi:hypothetical protein
MESVVRFPASFVPVTRSTVIWPANVRWTDRQSNAHKKMPRCRFIIEAGKAGCQCTRHSATWGHAAVGNGLFARHRLATLCREITPTIIRMITPAAFRWRWLCSFGRGRRRRRKHYRMCRMSRRRPYGDRWPAWLIGRQIDRCCREPGPL